jgi:hypothetical protein
MATVKDLAAQNEALKAEMAELKALIIGSAPSAPAKAAPSPSAPLVVITKAPAKVPSDKVRSLCKATREAFEAAALAEGYDFSQAGSNLLVAEWCIDNGYTPKGFTIGEGYLVKVAERKANKA